MAEQQFLASQRFADNLQQSFSYQHLAKLYIDQGRYNAAQALLEQALKIRKSLKRPDLVASTSKAMDGLVEMK